MAERLLSRLPLPGLAQWVEAGSHPAVMDTTRAEEQLAGHPAAPASGPCGRRSSPAEVAEPGDAPRGVTARR